MEPHEYERNEAMEAALAAMADWRPTADDFVRLAILLERSSAATAADPTCGLRIACLDAIDARGLGRHCDVSTFGTGLIETWSAVLDDRIPGPGRALLRGATDHTRVDLAKALRQTQFLSGPLVVVVIGSMLADVPLVIEAGVEHEDGLEPQSGAESSNDGDADPFDGRYGVTVIQGVLGRQPGQAAMARCAQTGGAALSINSPTEVETFAARCADLHRDVIEQVEADCVSGALDLDDVYGFGG